MLTHCPCCKYDLTGLPEQHRCPECGYDYDRDSEVIPLQSPPPLWIKILILFQVALALLYFGRLILTMRADTYGVMFYAHLAVLIAYTAMFFSSRPLAILRPLDIQIAFRRKITAQYSLDGVTHACPDFSGASVRLLDADQAEVLRIPRSYQYTGAGNLKLVTAINNRLKLRSESGGVTAVAKQTDNAFDSPAETSERP